MSKATKAGSSEVCHGNGGGDGISGRSGKSSDDAGIKWEDENGSYSDSEVEGEENPNEPRPPRIAAGGYAITGDFRKELYLNCMWCNEATASIYRTCCDKFYCGRCARSCCLYNANASFSTELPQPFFSQDMVVPFPYPLPQFPFFFHEATNWPSSENREMLVSHTFINWHDMRDKKKKIRAIEYDYQFDEEGKQIGCTTSELQMIHPGHNEH